VRDGLADHWRESYVGEIGKSMKAVELAAAQEGCWRKIAIALIGDAISMNKVCENPLQSATDMLKHMAVHKASRAFAPVVVDISRVACWGHSLRSGHTVGWLSAAFGGALIDGRPDSIGVRGAFVFHLSSADGVPE
jgi:hypothetical protein